MYGKRLAGTYFAKSSIDDGIGTFFLNVTDENTMEGFWSGYDNVNSTIATGKYIFKRQYVGFSLREATVDDFPAVIKIADAQLGDGYLTADRLEKVLDGSLSDTLWVAAENVTGHLIGFSLFRHIPYEEARKIGGSPFRNMMFAKEIGYLATVAVKESFKGLGIGTALVAKSINVMKDRGVRCFISTAWKHAGVINIGSVLERQGFVKEAEIPRYWYESSLKEGFMCPQCGNPCTCSCVIYTKV
ncbi:MAG: GNAT family N-acetyltransferase, partial [Clostridia bacterium]|nr:GNAT family N-acetyltransferase [Clostridia bacterium]